MTNREIAQEIINRIGNNPVPFDSIYSIALQIYNELGGDETQFDSVYSILLEILPLVEGCINPIKEVNELPKASENKDKFFRLDNGDKDVYAAKLLSSKTITTNRLPDAQQIDKAYLYLTGDVPYYYKGTYKIVCTNGEIEGYGWLEKYDNGVWCFFLTKDDAVNVTADSVCTQLIYSSNKNTEEIDEVNKIIIVNDDKANLDFADNLLSTEELIPITATYNAPESAQIGNATFTDSNRKLTTLYSGDEVTYNGSIWYKWTTNSGYYIINKKASEIYGDFKNYWMSDAKIVYFNGSEYVETELYSDITNINISQLNAPDSEQVNNAYIYDIYGQHKYFYKGLESIVCTDGTINVPHWIMEGTDGTQENNSLFTTPTANSLYKTTYENAFGLLNCQPNYSGQDHNIFYDTNNNLWKSTINSESTSQMITNSGSAESLFDSGVNVSTVKYQRTETTEEWDWQSLTDNATNDDIDAMFESPVGGIITIIREQDSAQQAAGFVDLWVNNKGETMEYNGQTYYKWVAWYNNPENGISEPIAFPNLIMLTNTLDIALPFNRNSSELEYVINYDEIENIFTDAYFKGNYTQKTVQ